MRSSIKNTFILLSCFSSISCINLTANNSTSQDQIVYSVTTTSTGGGTETENRLSQVLTILKQNCLSCHGSGSSSGALTYQTDAAWIQSGLVSEGSSANSTLFKKIRGNGISGSAADMPAGGGALSSDQVSVIKAWIDNMKTTNTDTSTTEGQLNAAARTQAAIAVLAANCNSCHNGTQTATSGAYNGSIVPAFGAYTTDNEFVVAGIVSYGSPTTSWIYRSLKTHGNIGTMPKSSSAISTTDAEKLSSWITNLGSP